MIHRAIFGSFERFTAILTENFQGEFPVWLSPVQVIILPITDKLASYGQDIVDELKSKNVRVNLDDRKETLQAKIRDATLQKIPYLIIVGEKEAKSKTLTVRTRKGKDLGQKRLAEFSDLVLSDIDNRS